ncbi:MAG: pilin [Patescibacteria group bacterium]|nr:pilin [Patescibacteria group bacterium]
MKKILVTIIILTALVIPRIAGAAVWCSFVQDGEKFCAVINDTEVDRNMCKDVSNGTVVTEDCTAETGGETNNGGGNSGASTVSLENPLNVGASPSTIIGLIIKSALGLIGGLALAMTVWGGFQWLVSAGNQEKVKKGSQTMLWAIIGLVLVLASFLLVDTFLKFLSGASQ